MNQLLLGSFKKGKSSINSKYVRSTWTDVGGASGACFLHGEAASPLCPVTVPAKPSKDAVLAWGGTTPHRPRLQNSSGAAALGAGQGLTARPGGGLGRALSRGRAALPLHPRPLQPPEPESRPDALPDTRPPGPCLNPASSPLRAGSPARPSDPSSRGGLLDFTASSRQLSAGLQPSFPLAGGEARERGQAQKEPGHEA